VARRVDARGDELYISQPRCYSRYTYPMSRHVLCHIHAIEGLEKILARCPRPIRRSIVMKTGTTFDRVQVRTLPTGRRCLTARQIGSEAALMSKEPAFSDDQRLALTQVASLCADADAHGQTCADLERRYAADALTAAKTASPRVPIDHEADQLVTSLRDSADVFTRLPATDPDHQTASGFLDSAFPKGLKHIIQATHAEQLQRMKTLVSYCQKDGAAAVADLGLSPWVKRIAAILPAYEEAVRAMPPDAVRFPEVRAAQQEGHLKLRQVIAQVFTAFPADSDDQERHRARLLAPLDRQEAAIAAAAKRKDPAKDVNPDTGAEVLPTIHEHASPDADTP
jgi:hypothetical protein